MGKLNQISKEDIRAAVEIASAVAQVIQSAGEIPSGELYAHLMGTMDIETYERLIQSMINTGLIRRERSHLLVWISE